MSCEKWLQGSFQLQKMPVVRLGVDEDEMTHTQSYKNLANVLLAKEVFLLRPHDLT